MPNDSSVSFNTKHHYERLDPIGNHGNTELGEVWGKVDEHDQPTGKVVGFADMTPAASTTPAGTSAVQTKKIQWGEAPGDFLKIKVAIKDKRQRMTIQHNSKMQRLVIPKRSDFYAAGANGAAATNVESIEIELRRISQAAPAAGQATPPTTTPTTAPDAQWAVKLYPKTRDEREQNVHKLTENDHFKAQFMALNDIGFVNDPEQELVRGYDLRGHQMPESRSRASLHRAEGNPTEGDDARPDNSTHQTPPAEPACVHPAPNTKATHLKHTHLKPTPTKATPIADTTGQSKRKPTAEADTSPKTSANAGADKKPDVALAELEAMLATESARAVQPPQNTDNSAQAFCASQCPAGPNPNTRVSFALNENGENKQANTLKNRLKDLILWCGQGWDLLKAKDDSQENKGRIFNHIRLALVTWQTGLTSRRESINTIIGQSSRNSGPKQNSDPKQRAALEALRQDHIEMLNQVNVLQETNQHNFDAINTPTHDPDQNPDPDHTSTNLGWRSWLSSPWGNRRS